ncbi:hypothetical protein EMCG_04299 [[Emmonsia] crescens]|uniref:Uncharacterized protein n=1 Tax=[Emmonsia] crescens TaxID=73230 RepID=A0A0G2HSU3_9EURO|nr:hypothetical protein EMCG_04299 [Emmonsia crescens UAMH 3008]
MSHPKTYFILPTTSYAPDDLIKLGQVIVDPRIPYRRLAEPLPLEGRLIPRKAATIEWNASKADNTAANAGVFTHIHGLLAAQASVKRSQCETYNWEGALLETHFIELDEHPEFVQQTATEVPAVSQWLKENNRLFGRTVYMITGVKTASKPGKATYGAANEQDVVTELRATAAFHPGMGAPAKVGAEAGYHNSGDIHVQGTPQDSFVFAYQLRKLHIGWRSKASLREHVGGADLHGIGQSNPSRDRLPSLSSENDAVYEIGDVKYEKDDFGASLPKKDVKVSAIDDCDGQQCLMVQATVC